MEDYEILVWKYKSSTKKDADIAISLEWPESVDEVGLRFKVIEKHGTCHEVMSRTNWVLIFCF